MAAEVAIRPINLIYKMQHQRIIDAQLSDLREKLLSMGAEAQNMLESAMRSLTERDSNLARKAVERDNIVDRMEIEIDRLCIETIATRQPVAHDLRFIISASKLTPILERIADHAGSIAEAALFINNEPELKEYVDLPLMAETAGEMLNNALEAFTSEDAEAARRIIKRDDVIDACYKRVFNELIEMMVEDSSVTAIAAQLLFVAKHLERIGDYVKDLCEQTVYMKEAIIIKHHPVY